MCVFYLVFFEFVQCVLDLEGEPLIVSSGVCV